MSGLPSASISMAVHPLIRCLCPVSSLLQTLCNDADVAALLGVSRAFALQILRGYTFHQHVFVARSQQELQRLKSLYEAYDLRITRMCVAADVQALTLEEGTGRSPFPSSLTSLLLGPVLYSSARTIHDRSMFGPYTEEITSAPCLCGQLGEELTDAQCRRVMEQERLCLVRSFAVTHSAINCELPPGLLPHGLLRLQLGTRFNTQFQVGSLPAGLQYLQCDGFNQRLSVGGMTVLPLSLLTLIVGLSFHEPLAGLLPPSLLQLDLGGRWNEQLVGLPSSLVALDLSPACTFGVQEVPSHVRHLGRVTVNGGPLPSQLVCLELAIDDEHHLDPGDLPASLRLLRLLDTSHQPLSLGFFPAGLLALEWHTESDATPLVPGLLPDALQLVKLLGHHKPIAAGAVPASVRVLRLNRRLYEGCVAEMGLSPRTVRGGRTGGTGSEVPRCSVRDKGHAPQRESAATSASVLKLSIDRSITCALQLLTRRSSM